MKCKNCGYPLDNDAIYCINCGCQVTRSGLNKRAITIGSLLAALALVVSLLVIVVIPRMTNASHSQIPIAADVHTEGNVASEPHDDSTNSIGFGLQSKPSAEQGLGEGEDEESQYDDDQTPQEPATAEPELSPYYASPQPESEPLTDGSYGGDLYYWAGGNNYYHLDRDCSYISNCADVKSGSKEQAENSGATKPCKECAAGDTNNTGNNSSKTKSQVVENGTYTSRDEVALYIHQFGHLPSNFITKSEAKKQGWIASEGNLHDVLPGMSIGGDRFGNNEDLLPTAENRSYTECDIDYQGGRRDARRIVFSNDGLIFYTDDHYNSFVQAEFSSKGTVTWKKPGASSGGNQGQENGGNNTGDNNGNSNGNGNNNGNGNAKAKTYDSSVLDNLEGTEYFASNGIEHIFMGEINKSGKAVGYHYNMISDSPGKQVKNTQSAPDKNGVYEAEVTVNGKKKSGNNSISSFFPDTWSPQEVVDAILEARSKIIGDGSEMKESGSAKVNGITISMYLDSNGNVITAYPVYQGA